MRRSDPTSIPDGATGVTGASVGKQDGDARNCIGVRSGVANNGSASNGNASNGAIMGTAGTVEIDPVGSERLPRAEPV